MTARSRLLALTLLAAGCGRPALSSLSTELFITPRQVDFGDVYVGARPTAALEVTNPGKLAQTVQPAVAAPFEAPLTLDVPGGSSVTVQLFFRPTRPGPYEASLVLGAEVVPLRGRGLEVPECRESDNRCTQATFELAQGQCVERPRPDGTACTSRCVTAGNCSMGTCLGAFLRCDDGDACTDDGCTLDRGCVHPPKQCPASPTNPCRVGSCDPASGCRLTDALDGTSCGPRNCRTNTTRVCIGAQCVDRPLPTPECLNQFGYLKASNADPADAFGGRIALSADGNTLAVGSTVESSSGQGVNADQADNAAPHSGAVYVFHRSGNAWIQQAYLKASNTGAGDAFGYSLALSADGNTLVVGAHLEDSAATGINGNQLDDSALNSGAAYVFVRRSGAWTQEAYLKASNAEQSDRFGSSVALSGDGSWLAVGAAGDDSQAGAVYVFQRTLGWTQEAHLKASNAQGGDQFGFSLALSSDGTTLAVAAPGEDSKALGVDGAMGDNSAPNSGAVYLFQLLGFGFGWTQVAYLKASNTGAGDVFGISLALSANGAALAVGAYGEDSGATGVNQDQADNTASQSGAVYLFRKPASLWAQQAYLKASNTRLGDDFGFSVALSADGDTLAVGAFGENSGATGIDGHQLDTSGPDSGAVYLFHYAAGWTQQAYVKESNTGAGDVFGHSVGLSADGATLVSAAIGEDSGARGVNGNQNDDSASDSGAVYVFSLQ